jgi:PAS domain-containing protein
MSDHILEPAVLADLRSRAASRLTGAAASKGSPARMTDALSALHTLASSPKTASDALALLHELQVHQVELDLQAEELRESRAELESALRHQIDLYDLQPVGCFTIDLCLVVHELNQAAARMLGIERDEAHGASLDTFLPVDSQRMLKERVCSVAGGEQSASCLLGLHPTNEPERLVRADIRAQPGTQRYLVVLTNVGDEHGSQPEAR